LKNLQVLDCSNGSLTAIPDEIGQLTQLVTLDARKNSLTSYSIPSTIKNLNRLERLILG